jgi:hypothetical protein
VISVAGSILATFDEARAHRTAFAVSLPAHPRVRRQETWAAADTQCCHYRASGSVQRVDIIVIAIWLGHEDTATTYRYIEADLAIRFQRLR